MQSPIDTWFLEKLNKRKSDRSLRSLRISGSLIDFTSNDYLGFGRSEILFQKIHEKISGLPKLNGSTGSRLLSGNSILAEEMEAKLSDIFKAKGVLLFNSGYSANLAVLSAIPQKGDTIICDQLVHASIKDGMRLSQARRFAFRHNDVNDLEKKMKLADGKKFVVVESVYSMDGDACPLHDVIALAEKYDATIILDEAHSTGVEGPLGAGYCVEQGLQDRVAIRIHTFGKGMGVHGASVSGSKALIDYLINFARPFIYTTALPPHQIASISAAFDYLAANIHLQQILREKIDRYVARVGHLNNRTPSASAIQTVLCPGNEAVQKMAGVLQEGGFDVRPIRSPTVPKGSERLRICVHTFNSDEEIEALTAALGSWKQGPDTKG